MKIQKVFKGIVLLLCLVGSAPQTIANVNDDVDMDEAGVIMDEDVDPLELHNAIQQGNGPQQALENVQAILNNPNLNINLHILMARNGHNQTPLHVAARREDFSNIVILLLQAIEHFLGHEALVAAVNALDNQNNTPLHNAAGVGDPNTVMALLDIGANRNIANINQETPLQRAIIQQQFFAAPDIDPLNPDINPHNQEIALHFAAVINLLNNYHNNAH